MSARLRSRRSSERGSALVLAVLILFAMLGLGMLAMRSATQNIAGSGNLRLNKQARYVAEIGVHHALRLARDKTEALLGARASDQTIEVDSAGAVKKVRDDVKDDIEGMPGAPAVLAVEPASLGAFQVGIVPSYRVTIDGFVPVAAASGAVGEVDCQMSFTSQGFVASEALPADLAAIDPEARFATYTIRVIQQFPMPAGASCLRTF